MRWLRLALLPATVGMAVAAERGSNRHGDFRLVLADAAVGLVLVTCGVIAWKRRSESRVGPLMAVSGLAWFAGNFVAGALYLHRGPLVHLHISYPTGRLTRRFTQATVATAYIAAAVEPVARNDVLTLVLAALVATAAADVFLRTSGTARRAGVPALVAALLFAGVLALGAVARVADWDADQEVLWAYDVVIAGVTVVLLVDLLRGRWADAVVADLVVDLGKRSDTRTLREELGRALGDRSLVLGYWLPEEQRYIDDAGRPVELPKPGGERVVTPIVDRGGPVAILVHDEAVLHDPALVEAVAAVGRMAVSNARLQADVRARVRELAVSRRRVVEAGEVNRRRLERELHAGAEARLDRVAELLADIQDHTAEGAADVAAVVSELGVARAELHNFAQGIHPRALTEGGLSAALPALTDPAGVPVELDIFSGRLAPAVEAAVYFMCSEALANAVKHAKATTLKIAVSRSSGLVHVAFVDDGIGGADPAKGSGLRGLTDRAEALGGQLSVISPVGGGTRLEATLPVDREQWGRDEPSPTPGGSA